MNNKKIFAYDLELELLNREDIKSIVLVSTLTNTIIEYSIIEGTPYARHWILYYIIGYKRDILNYRYLDTKLIILL